MKSQKLFVSLFAVLALLIVSAASVAAFGSISAVEVNGVDALSGVNLANFAGQTVPVLVVFDATADATDVRVKAWVSGAKGYSVSSERFDVLAGNRYVRTISVQLPSDIDRETEESFELEISVESRNDGIADSESIELLVQRESYVLDILDVIADTQVKAGENLALDIVLKNRGRQFSDDAFVVVRVPALGIADRAYFGDLSPIDQDDPDKEDAAERRMYLKIPTSAPAGVYVVEVEAYNDDSVVTKTSKIAIVGAASDSMGVSPAHSKTFGVGEVGEYSITLVNSGNRVQVYELVFETTSGLTLEASEPIVAVPAGTSKTVKVGATAAKAGTYDFAVNVQSDSQLVKRESFTAKVEGKGLSRSTGANATVLLTVILAIIFIVLLVVLIVLLARKPETKSEEFGESYY